MSEQESRKALIREALARLDAGELAERRMPRSGSRIARHGLARGHRDRRITDFFLGWLWADRRPPLTEEREAALADALLTEHPRLRWAASYRSGIFECDPRDPTHILQAMREYVADDPAAGDPEWLARGAAGAAVIGDIVEACIQRDRPMVLRALDRAAMAYSTDGADLLRTAVLNWLDGPAGAPQTA